jgi:hypothetical protein
MYLENGMSKLAYDREPSDSCTQVSVSEVTCQNPIISNNHAIRLRHVNGFSI